MIIVVLIVTFVDVVKKALYKQAKTTTDKQGNVIVNKVENRSSWKVGNGRNTTPDGNAIFKTNLNDNEDVDTVDTGPGFCSRKPTPEERIEVLEKEVEELTKNLGLNRMD